MLTQKKKMKRGAEQERLQGGLAEACFKLLSGNDSLSEAGATEFESIYPIVNETTELGLRFHATRLHTTSVDEEMALFPKELRDSQTSFLLAQLVGFNARPIIGDMFSEERKTYPDIKQAVFMIFQVMLKEYQLGIDVTRQNRVFTGLMTLFELIKGRPGTAVEAHFLRQIEDAQLQESLHKLFFKFFEGNAHSISTADQSAAFIDFLENTIYPLTQLPNKHNLDYVSTIQPIVLNGFSLPDPQQRAIATLYYKIVTAYESSSPSRAAWMSLLEMIRGESGSAARAAFNMLWHYADCSNAVVLGILVPRFESALFRMLDGVEEGANLKFWTHLLDTIAPTSSVAQGFFVKMFSRTKVIVRAPGAGGEGKKEPSYAGWAMALCERANFDWSKIDVDVLTKFIAWGAPVASLEQFPIMQSLIWKINAGEHVERYLTIALNIVSARESEALPLITMLYGAGLVEPLIHHILATRHTKALTILMDPKFESILLKPLFKEVSAGNKTLVTLLEILWKDTRLVGLLLDHIIRNGRWEAVCEQIVWTKSAAAVYALNKLGCNHRVTAQHYLVRGLDLGQALIEKLMFDILERCADNEDPFAAIEAQTQTWDEKRRSMQESQAVFRERLDTAARSRTAAAATRDEASATIEAEGEATDDATMLLINYIHDERWIDLIAQLKGSVTPIDLIAVREKLKASAGYQAESKIKNNVDAVLAAREARNSLRDSLKKARAASVKQRAQRGRYPLPCVEDVQRHPAYHPTIENDEGARQLLAQHARLLAQKEEENAFGSYLFAVIDGHATLYVLLEEGTMNRYDFTSDGYRKELKLNGGKTCWEMKENTHEGINSLDAFLAVNKHILKEALRTSSQPLQTMSAEQQFYREQLQAAGGYVEDHTLDYARLVKLLEEQKPGTFLTALLNGKPTILVVLDKKQTAKNAGNRILMLDLSAGYNQKMNSKTHANSKTLALEPMPDVQSAQATMATFLTHPANRPFFKSPCTPNVMAEPIFAAAAPPPVATDEEVYDARTIAASPAASPASRRHAVLFPAAPRVVIDSGLYDPNTLRFSYTGDEDL